MSTPVNQLNLPPSAGAGQMPDLSALLQTPSVPQYKTPDTSQYDKAAAAGMGQAKAAQGKLEGLESGASDLTDAAAKAYGSGIAAEDQAASQMPSSAQFYAHAMKTAPLVAMMAALGGKAAGLSGEEMLGALNGMMSGFNAGSAQNYQEALARWQAGLKQLKERNAEQLEMYKLMLDAYQGRIDAAQKARDFALSMTGDAISAKEAAVKDSIDIFSARAKAADALSQHSLGLEKFLYSMMKGKQDQSATQMTPRGQEISSEVAMLGISIPAGMGSKNRVQIYNSLASDPKYSGMSPHQIAEQIKENKIGLSAQTRAANTEANIAGKVSYAEKEIPKMASMVEQISAQVPRDKFVPVNRLMQMADASISNPQLRQLKIAINSMLNAYDVLAARGGTDVAKREEAHRLLSSADSPQALRAALTTFQQEASIAGQAAQEAIQEAVSGAGLVAPPGGETSSGPQEGAKGTSKSGKPIVFRNGRWEYVSG